MIDAKALIGGSYCGQGQSLSYQFSLVVFGDKELLDALPDLAAKDIVDKQKKANGDL